MEASYSPLWRRGVSDSAPDFIQDLFEALTFAPQILSNGILILHTLYGGSSFWDPIRF